MKKLMKFFLAIFLFSTGIFAQAPCQTPPGNGIYVMIDPTYTVGTVTAGTTAVRLCYANTTTTNVTALQFRVWYDKNAFNGDAPVVTSLNTTFPQDLQYQTNVNEGYVTITLTYTGSSNTFSIPNGNLFQIQLTHSINFATITAITNISATGTTAFNNLSSNVNGLDDSLIVYNFGGVMSPVMFNYNGTFTNVTGTPAKNIPVILEKKVKTGGSWTAVTTVNTDTNGAFAFVNQPIDVTYYDTRLRVQGDALTDNNVISIADAQRVNQFVLGTATPVGFDFYSADVNGSNTITVADVYSVYGRIAGRFTSWPNSVPDVKFFTDSEFATINTSTTSQQTAIPGVTNLVFDILPTTAPVTFYVLGNGDANGTGFNMARLVPISIANPSHTPGYIIDATTEYDNPDLKTIEVRMPEVEVNEGNLVSVPVSLRSNDGPIGSLQLAMYYDPELLEFKSVETEAKTMNWMSFINPVDNVIEWGGFDTTANQNLVNDGEKLFSLQFIALRPQSEWANSALQVSRKYSGDSNSKDLKITPTNGIITINKIDASVANLGNSNIRVYPNPTSGYVNVAFRVTKPGNTTLYILDIMGRRVFELLDQKMPEGKYNYSFDLGNLADGVYNAVIDTEALGRDYAKIIKIK
jgi:hypothetical protein